MNKTLMLGIVGVVILGGIVWWATSNTSTQEEGTDTASSTSSSGNTQTGGTTGAVAGNKSLRQLIALGVPQRCTFEDKDSGNMGSVYISGGKVRGDFNSGVEGEIIKAHMLMDGVNTYIWTDGMTQGFKTSANAQASAQAQSQSVSVDKEMNYTCEAWTTDQYKFELPANVTFTDFSAGATGAAR